MALVLVIETSSRPFGVALGIDGNVLFDSSEPFDKSSLPDERDLALLVERGLQIIGKRTSQITAIAVNIGPGGLGSVRSGVSFANALALGLRIPVCPFTAFELMGFEAWKKNRLPVLCTARAAKGSAYLGLYDQGAVTAMKFGALEEITSELTAGLGEFTVAGAYRSSVQELLPDSKIHDSGIRVGQARTFMEMAYPIAERGKRFPHIAIPINEQSEMLDE